MVYTYKYKSPLGNILLAADEVGLTGLWFEGQKYFAKLNWNPSFQFASLSSDLANRLQK